MLPGLVYNSAANLIDLGGEKVHVVRPPRQNRTTAFIQHTRLPLAGSSLSHA
jgi:hypothetical protein